MLPSTTTPPPTFNRWGRRFRQTWGQRTVTARAEIRSPKRLPFLFCQTAKGARGQLRILFFSAWVSASHRLTEIHPLALDHFDFFLFLMEWGRS